MTTLLMPTTELTAAGWIALALDLGAANVGLTLPQHPETWYQPGFVQVGPVAGGTPDAYTPMRSPVVSVHVWAVNGTQDSATGTWSWSNKPPWNRCAELCEQIRAASLLTATASNTTRRTAMLPAGYAHATVATARMLTEPRRMLSDPAGYAHLQFDLYLKWIPQGS